VNQAVSFGLLLAGGILVDAALTGHGLADVLQGKAGSVPTVGSTLGQGVAGVGSAIGAATSGVANAAGYVNPFAGASVTPERIDQGVDYAGTGTVSAIGAGTVTSVFAPGSSGSGWPGGGYVEYKLTSGPDAGAYIYAAEGLAPTVTVGQTVQAGQAIANIIPGSSTGIETGLGSGVGTSTYAAQHGGYGEGALTAAGQWFSDLVKALGGPAGLTQGRQVTGQTPPYPIG
jgi:hypothetical protein